MIRPIARSWVLGAAACLVCASALGEDGLREERLEVERKLGAQKAALELLHEQRIGVLEIVELIERMSRATAAQERAAALESSLVESRILLAEQEAAVAKAYWAQGVRRLGPRLTVLYRMTRARPLDLLLSAKDLAAGLRRSRAMTALLREDLELLGEVQQAYLLQNRAVAQLRVLRQGLSWRAEAARAGHLRAERQRRDLSDMLELIQAETSRSGRIARELEAADKNLFELIAQAESAPAASGFGALKGRLPLPAQGIIEVGFGRVVNPRFNTVTVQRGLDIRARLGEPVVAVAPGQVVYANWLKGYGNLVIVDHGEAFHTLVAHLSQMRCKVGDKVAAGDELGKVGDTGSLKGAYLYFEVRQKGQPVDPSIWLASGERIAKGG